MVTWITFTLPEWQRLYFVFVSRYVKIFLYLLLYHRSSLYIILRPSPLGIFAPPSDAPSHTHHHFFQSSALQKCKICENSFVTVSMFYLGRRHRGCQGGHGPPTFCKAKLLKTNFYKQNI